MIDVLLSVEYYQVDKIQLSTTFCTARSVTKPIKSWKI